MCCHLNRLSCGTRSCRKTKANSKSHSEPGKNINCVFTFLLVINIY